MPLKSSYKSQSTRNLYEFAEEFGDFGDLSLTETPNKQNEDTAAAERRPRGDIDA
ncbi:MAG: hypothetical protein P4N59_31190 [Negativicutes bacterium]|nr:hypothetical protein [Negativicutes bacterium]